MRNRMGHEAARLFLSIMAIAGLSLAPAAHAKPAAKKKVAVEQTTLPEETNTEEKSLEAKLVVDAPVALAGETIETAVAPVQPAGQTLPKAEIAKLPESEIPVLATVKEEKKPESGTLIRLMSTLGVLAVILGAASFGLKKWMAKSAKNKENTRIKMLTQHHLGPKKSLAIIQVAGEAILIGVTDHNISMLKTLSLLDDEIPEATPTNFGQTLQDFEGGGEEDFTISGLNEIRDRVSTKTKAMRRI